MQLNEVSVTEQEGAERSQARVKYLVELGEPHAESVVQWNSGRMDRLLADYFLRSGCSETAQTIIQSSNIDVVWDFGACGNGVV